MMKKYDLHCHSHFSVDSLNNPQDLVRRYYKLGFSGFAITDHNSFKAYEQAQEYVKRKKIDIEVIPACEFGTSRGEVIGLYLQEMIYQKDFACLCDAIHDQGGFVILPHPFDSFRKSATHPDKFDKEDLRFVDAIETINGHVLLKNDNLKAMEFADLHSFAKTAGSDAHLLIECASAFTTIADEMGLDIAIRSKNTCANGKQIPFYTRGIPTLIKIAKKVGLIKKDIENTC